MKWPITTFADGTALTIVSHYANDGWSNYMKGIGTSCNFDTAVIVIYEV